MAQASSAQREPSMEEILASIRRIIEDGETGQRQAASSAPAEAAGEVAAFREELKPSPHGESVERRERDRREEQQAPARPTLGWSRAEEEPQPRNEDAAEPASEASEPTDATPQSAGPEESAPTARPASMEEPDEARQPPQTARNPEPLRPAAASAPAGVSRSRAEARPAILSEEPGRKVAAAFEELNEAYEASRRKSLADAAEEMLRPMLQEWLDNNLPQLVERLVREEIERVARGG